MKKNFFTVFFIFIIFPLYAQYYSTGTDRACTKWRKIDTPSFEIVYPESFEKQAVRLVNILENIKGSVEAGLKCQTKKIPILLHTETAVSNGYVAWAPKRSEFYATPPDDGLTDDWLRHLATHEYRHVVQMNKINKGTTEVLRVVFGEQIIPVVLGLNVPSWFLEGDAVVTETLLSQSGRGRSGKFLQVMKAYLTGNEKWYNYDKATLGSYKDFVPSIYHLGYSLVSNTRKNYGVESWEHVLRRVASKPYEMGAFGKNIATSEERKPVFNNIVNELDSISQNNKRKGTFEMSQFWEQWVENKHRNSAKTLYNDNLSELQARWKQQRMLLDTTAYIVHSPTRKYYTNYTEPKLLSDGRILALKSGLDTYEQFVILSKGKEQHFYTSGNISGGVRLNEELLYWTEIVPHIRWEEVSKSVIFSLNIKTKEKKKWDFPYNLFMPYFDDVNKKLVAVSKNKNYTQDLIVFNTETKKEILKQHFETKNIIDPFFIDASHIAYLFVKEGMGIEILNIHTKKIERQVFYPNVMLSDLTIEDGSAYFTADFNGKNDLYKLDFANKKLQKVTETAFGGGQFTLSGNKVIYANYTPMGYEIAEMTMDDALMKNVEHTEFKEDSLLGILQKQELKIDKDSIDKKTNVVVSSKPYRRIAHLFNIHSWSPLVMNPDEGRLDLGVSVQSQNLLSTMFLTAGYRLENGKKHGETFAKVSYRGWFPVLSSQISYGRKKDVFYGIVKSPSNVDTLLISERKKRLMWKSNISLPLNLSRGKYFRKVVLSAHHELQKNIDITTETYFTKQNLGMYGNKAYQLLSYSFYFSNKHKAGYRDLQTSWGQVVRGSFSHNPFATKNYTYSLESSFYLPSVFKHHGMRIYGGYQYFYGKDALSDLNIHNGRGLIAMVGKHNYRFSVDYSFPLAYPEWNILGLAYFKRFKTTFFYDTTRTVARKLAVNQMSCGLEFRADTHFFRLPIPVNIGFRFGYENQTDNYFSNFLFSVSF